MSTKRIEHVDNVKPSGFARDVLIEMMTYCSITLDISDAEIGRIFRRDRANVKRILDKANPKRRTAR